MNNNYYDCSYIASVNAHTMTFNAVCLLVIEVLWNIFLTEFLNIMRFFHNSLPPHFNLVPHFSAHLTFI